MSVSQMSRAEPEAPQETPKKSKKKLIAVALVFVLAGAAYWFVLKPSGGKHEKAAPEPGPVVVLEPIQVNLAAGHYLKIGLALQSSADAGEELDGSQALDSTIDLFSGLPMEEVTLAEDRARLKRKLLHDLEERYEGHVYDVYFTEFVTQ